MLATKPTIGEQGGVVPRSKSAPGSCTSMLLWVFYTFIGCAPAFLWTPFWITQNYHVFYKIIITQIIMSFNFVVLGCSRTFRSQEKSIKYFKIVSKLISSWYYNIWRYICDNLSSSERSSTFLPQIVITNFWI